MTWALRLSRRAEDAFQRLSPVVRKRVVRRLDQLVLDPLSPDYSKPLRCGRRSARVGDYRILFTVDADAGDVLADRIGPRGQIYR